MRIVITILKEMNTNFKLKDMDLFERPELIPVEVQKVLNTFNDESGNAYRELERIERELQQLGFTFDFGLDADPYDLRPVVK